MTLGAALPCSHNAALELHDATHVQTKTNHKLETLNSETVATMKQVRRSPVCPRMGLHTTHLCTPAPAAKPARTCELRVKFWDFCGSAHFVASKYGRPIFWQFWREGSSQPTRFGPRDTRGKE